MTDADTAPKKRGRKPFTPEQKAESAQRKADAKAAAKKDKPAKTPKVTEAPRVRREDLTEDQDRCLLLIRAGQLRRQATRAKTENDELKRLRDEIRGELGKLALHEINLLESLETEAGKNALREKVEMERRIARYGGYQISIFEFSEDRTPSIDAAFDAGKRAGMLGEDCKAPQGMGMAQEQKWLEGWHAGHAVNVGLLALMAAPKGRDLDEGAQTDVEGYLNRHYKAGYAAREAGENPVIPEGLNKSEASEFKRGIAECEGVMARRGKPIDYEALGADAFHANREMVAPDTVPAHEHGAFRIGYQRAAREAHDKKQPVAA